MTPIAQDYSVTITQKLVLLSVRISIPLQKLKPIIDSVLLIVSTLLNSDLPITKAKYVEFQSIVLKNNGLRIQLKLVLNLVPLIHGLIRLL